MRGLPVQGFGGGVRRHRGGGRRRRHHSKGLRRRQLNRESFWLIPVSGWVRPCLCSFLRVFFFVGGGVLLSSYSGRGTWKMCLLGVPRPFNGGLGRFSWTVCLTAPKWVGLHNEHKLHALLHELLWQLYRQANRACFFGGAGAALPEPEAPLTLKLKLMSGSSNNEAGRIGCFEIARVSGCNQLALITLFYL